MFKHYGKILLAIAASSVCAGAGADGAAPVPDSGNGAFMQVTDYDKRCYGDVPEYVAPDRREDVRKVPISISSDSMQSNIRTGINYSGNVEIVQGRKTLKADETTFNQATQEMTASGNIHYQDGEITVRSPNSLYTNLDTNQTELNDAVYQINGTVVRGKTRKAVLNNGEKTITLHDASVTTCPADQESWSLESDKISIDQSKVFGEAYNTVFRFYDVPLLYLPYFNFPVKNVRKSGLLYPDIEYTSTDGGMLTMPVYWNIAPNYDFTYSPKIISRRGLLNTGEFRYMPFRDTSGILYAQYINHDRRDAPDGRPNPRERWLVNLRHGSYFLGRDLGVEIDYTRIRDKDYNYVKDFDPDITEPIDNQLVKSGRVFYDADRLEASVLYLQYQQLVPEIYRTGLPFKLMPRVELGWHDTPASFLSYGGNFEYSRFQLDHFERQRGYKGERYHFQPEIEIPFVNNEGLEIRAAGRGFITHYNQNIPASLSPVYTFYGFGPGTLDDSVTRYLYEAEVYGKAVFVNDRGPFVMTVEPEVQYMYIPYKDQSGIGIYDSTDRVYDFYSLFSYKKYAGIDRIADTNRISYGVTYRIFDRDYREKLRFNLGQGYDFRSQKMNFYPDFNVSSYPRTPVAASLNLSLWDYLSANGGMVYNTERRETSTWYTQVNGMYEDFKAQLSYRYMRDGNRTVNADIIDLKQLGGTVSFPITADVKGIAAMYYDLEQHHNIDQKLALKYESCCYSVGFKVERYKKPDNYTLTAKSETKVGVFFELKGLTEPAENNTFNPETKLIPYNETINLNR